jgi:hypothetical protein
MCTLSRHLLPARTARIVLPVTSPGTADTPHAESGMRYQFHPLTRELACAARNAHYRRGDGFIPHRPAADQSLHGRLLIARH